MRFGRVVLVAGMVAGGMSFAMFSQAAEGQEAATPPPAAKPTAAKPVVAPDPMRADWANLKRFHAEDAALAVAGSGQATGVKRVVFLGDSITEGWVHNGVPQDPPVAGLEYVNRGISGQTTPQMLVRFRQDVLDLKPDAVVILAGINDIAGNTGEMTLEETEGNLASMAELAQAHGIKVAMCSILPAFDIPWRPGREPGPKVVAINTWMKAYAAEHGHVYVDYYSAMADGRGGLPKELSYDGVHPTKAGYAAMQPLADAGIRKALGGS